MPQLNGMAIIGIISIPGMMTGQILGGSSVTQAARYQILITYFIAICSFGSTLAQSFLTLEFMFDSDCMLRTDRLIKRVENPSLLTQVHSLLGSFSRPSGTQRQSSGENTFGLPFEGERGLSVEILQTRESHKESVDDDRIILEMTGLARSIKEANGNGIEEDISEDIEDERTSLAPSRRYLFSEFTLCLRAGEIALVTGPSGVGKTTLLRCLAGMASLDKGSIRLNGISRYSLPYNDMTVWRQEVRYVPQSKVDIPGSPGDFLRRMGSFQVWNRHTSGGVAREGKEATLNKFKASAIELLKSWGMSESSMDSEWSKLSGGEAQRVVLALALATSPQVLLLDEITSALDMGTKLRVERSIMEHCKKHGTCALLITHDLEQMRRLRQSLG